MTFPAELSWAHPVTAEWFVRKFATPTEPQVFGWPSILAGKPTLISAPTVRFSRGKVADLLPPLTETAEGIRSDIIRRLPGW